MKTAVGGSKRESPGKSLKMRTAGRKGIGAAAKNTKNRKLLNGAVGR